MKIERDVYAMTELPVIIDGTVKSYNRIAYQVYQKKRGLISGLTLIIYQTQIVITFFRSGKRVFLLFVEGVRISY